jgi:hypothetical protein
MAHRDALFSLLLLIVISVKVGRRSVPANVHEPHHATVPVPDSYHRPQLVAWTRDALGFCQLASRVTDTTVVQPSIVTVRFLIRVTAAIVASLRGDERFVPVPNDLTAATASGTPTVGRSTVLSSTR